MSIILELDEIWIFQAHCHQSQVTHEQMASKKYFYPGGHFHLVPSNSSSSPVIRERLLHHNFQKIQIHIKCWSSWIKSHGLSQDIVKPLDQGGFGRIWPLLWPPESIDCIIYSAYYYGCCCLP